MEHDEITLDQKMNLRNKGTRYGIKTRNTVKYNARADRSYHQFHGEIEDVTNGSIKISLSKRKNWEVVKSLEDSDANVRIIEMDFKTQGTSNREVRHKAFPDEEPEPEAPVIVNGTNRKGFFVREKRRPGKRGVTRKERGAASDGEENSDSSSAEEKEDRQEPGEEPRVLCVWKRNNKQSERDWRKTYTGCDCEYCTGIEKNQNAKNRNAVRKELVDIL